MILERLTLDHQKQIYQNGGLANRVTNGKVVNSGLHILENMMLLEALSSIN